MVFYLIGEDEEKTLFKDEIGEDPERIHIQQGGNVLNTMWILSHCVLDSAVYMMIGNDLGFEYSEDEKKRQESFYAVGDYRMNILNKRNEAKNKFAWMGFDLYESSIVEGQLMYDLSPRRVSPQLWIYKTWLEVQASIWAGQKPFLICNCSEAGTLGVLYKSFDKGAINDRDNCYLIDHLLPRNWETTTLKRACEKFLEIKKCQATPMGTGNVVRLATR